MSVTNQSAEFKYLETFENISDVFGHQLMKLIGRSIFHYE